MDGTVGVAAADLAAGEQAGQAGVLTLSRRDSGHRSNLQLLFSSVVYLVPMSFKVNAPKLYKKKASRLNE